MATYPCRIPSTEASVALLRHLDATGVVAADHLIDRDGVIRATFTDDEIAALEAHGLAVERGKRLLTSAERGDTDGGGVDFESGFVNQYLDGEQVAARVQALAGEFPARCSVISLPFPTAGYDGSLAGAAGPATVLALRITTDPAVRSRPGFLVIGGTHAREWMNPVIALEFAEQLLRNVDTASTDPPVVAATRIVTEGDTIIVPALNPDGLSYSRHDDPGWRKNRRPNAVQPACPGVDDNRNYEVYFGGPGASASPCSESYHGVTAFSEAETGNVRWLLEEFPNILVGVDAHSYGQLILRPGPGGGAHISSLPVSAADHAIYSDLESTLRNAIAAVNGVTYSIGSTSNHAGTSDEYMFFAHRVFGFNTECGTSFQPAWAQAVPVIQEVVAGLRALGVATLDLSTTTPTPLQVVQCIDRTGSMIAFGYDGLARANGKRFIDLLSLGDSTGVVTFADPADDPGATPVTDRSRVELPLTLLNDPGDASTARDAVDGIVFGGWTPIGAGLQRSASMLSGAASPRAILLLSDGFENREPSVASVLASWPDDLRVFTIALGPAADAPLLQQIATDTGGVFQSSPGSLDLHQIYNQMRADITDEGLVINRAVRAETEDDQEVPVEPGADRLSVVVSLLDRAAPEVQVVAPSGRRVRSTDRGVTATRGEGYALFHIDRPQPGRWRVFVVKQDSACVVAAFVSSPLRSEIHLPPRITSGLDAQVKVRSSFDGTSLGRARVLARARSVPQASLPEKVLEIPEPLWPKENVRAGTSTRVGPGKLRPAPWRRGPLDLSPGFSRVEVEVDGVLPGGATFRRVAIRTVHA